MLSLEPQDARVGGAVVVGEGGNAPATPTQQGTKFGVKDAATEFRIKVSSKMSLEHADAQEGEKTTTMSCNVYVFVFRGGQIYPNKDDRF